MKQASVWVLLACVDCAPTDSVSAQQCDRVSSQSGARMVKKLEAFENVEPVMIKGNNVKLVCLMSRRVF